MSRLTLARKTLNRPRFSRRRAAAPDAANYTDGLWYDGFDNSQLVSVSGSQTLTYPTVDDSLQIGLLPSGQSAGDFNGLMSPASIPVGSKWRTEISIYTSSTDQFLRVGIALTDGVSSSSKAWSGVVYKSALGLDCHFALFDGTLTNMANAGQTTISTTQTRWSVWTYEIHYSAANTYVIATWPHRSPDNLWTSSARSSTMTPTHVGLIWSTWDDTPADVEIIAGPVYRYA